MSVIVWFRLDLRVADHPALHAALQRRGPIIPLFIWSPEEEAPWAPGAASNWWLHQSLSSLDAALRSAGSRLILRRGNALEVLQQVAKETGATALFFHRRTEPAVRGRDERVVTGCAAAGLHVESFNGSLLRDPSTILNQSGKPFQVFTPFWRACLKLADPEEPLAQPEHLPAPSRWPKSVPLEELALLPRIHWTSGIEGAWRPGRDGALLNLRTFTRSILADYDRSRDVPSEAGTSRLSPHLHFGEISPREVWREVQKALCGANAKNAIATGGWKQSRYLAELGWREFAHHLLYHFPQMSTESLRPEFRTFPWRSRPEWLKVWQRGRTGFPMVDAGMRELWATGWMHNRVRMIAGSFLVKQLLLQWQEGARWFWDTLVDADLASNSMGWQWVAGSGADAAPFFRIFNPVLQGGKFDPAGNYIRKWIPELSRLPDRWIHEPHRAPAAVLQSAGVVLGKTYPEPVVNPVIAREVALEAYARHRAKASK